MKGKYMVVAIRHFSNGEHHWIAPEAGSAFASEKTSSAAPFVEGTDFADDPTAFGSGGDSEYGKPLFEGIKDAEDWAMSMRNGEWALAQWEERRPTFLVIEEKAFAEAVERDSYPLPPEAEAWSDAKVADFERGCDIKAFKNAALWDSDTDEETVPEKDSENIVEKIISDINHTPTLIAYVDDDGIIAVEYNGPNRNKEAVADMIEATEGFPWQKVKWVSSDESAGIAFYAAK